MHVYNHNGPGGPVMATDASAAALVLARRKYGNWGGIESFRMIASKWLAHGRGWGEIGAKVWEVTLKTVPSPMMIKEGPVGMPTDYVRRSCVVRISQRRADLGAPASSPASKLPNGIHMPCLYHTRKNAGQ